MSLVRADALALAGRLRPTTLALAAGTLTCLVGPNGSGKTSLLHALARIGRPGGSVRIDDADPEVAPPASRRSLLAFLPASREIAWPLAARDVIALGGGDPAPWIAALALGELAARPMDRLSTGERSRVLIARALAAGPKLLLLDEPVSNLDPWWQLELMRLLRGYAAGGRAVVAAMHDLDLAGRFADRLLVMNAGHVVADGLPAAMLASDTLPKVFGIRRGADGWRQA